MVFVVFPCLLFGNYIMLEKLSSIDIYMMKIVTLECVDCLNRTVIWGVTLTIHDKTIHGT